MERWHHCGPIESSRHAADGNRDRAAPLRPWRPASVEALTVTLSKGADGGAAATPRPHMARMHYVGDESGGLWHRSCNAAMHQIQAEWPPRPPQRRDQSRMRKSPRLRARRPRGFEVSAREPGIPSAAPFRYAPRHSLGHACCPLGMVAASVAASVLFVSKPPCLPRSTEW